MNALPPLVVMGVSGSGKTTVGTALADRLGIDFIDGDDLHPPANKAKMAAGTPLTDPDREPWLRAIGEAIAAHTAAGDSIVVACSALKRHYRDVLRSFDGDIVFVSLSGDAGTIGARLAERRHEYMPASLLGSQLAALEPLAADERRVDVDIANEPAEIVDTVVAALATRAVAGAHAATQRRS